MLNNLTINLSSKIFFIAYFLIALHFPLKHTGGHGLYLPFNIICWIFISIIIGLGLFKIGISRKIYFSKYFLNCCYGFALILIPLTYYNNEHSILSFNKIAGFGFGIILLFALKQFRFNKKDNLHLIYLILMGILIQGLLKLCIQTLPNSQFLSLISNLDFGAMAQKNIFATFLATGITISLALISLDKDHSKFKNMIIFSIPLVGMTQFYPLQSKMGYISLFLGVGIGFMASMKKGKTIAIWMGCLFFGYLIGMNINRLDRSNTDIKHSISTRMSTYLLTCEIIKENPFFGIGYGNFLSTFRKHYADRKASDSSIQTIGNNNMNHPHNEVLFWIVEGGILSFLGLLVIAGGLIATLWNGRRKKGWIFLSMIIPILVHTQLELPFYISTIHWFIFIFIIFMIDNELGNEYELDATKLGFLFKSFSIICTSFNLIYFSTALHTAILITKFERTGRIDPSILVKVKNSHAWQKKYETTIMKLDLEIAKATKDKDKLSSYVNWAKNYLNHSPYLFIYYDLAKAYELLGHREKGWEIYNQAKHLYPGVNWKDD